MNPHHITIELDRSTLEWLVVEHYERGWSVVGRFTNNHDAHLWRRKLIVREDARGGKT